MSNFLTFSLTGLTLLLISLLSLHPHRHHLLLFLLTSTLSSLSLLSSLPSLFSPSPFTPPLSLSTLSLSSLFLLHSLSSLSHLFPSPLLDTLLVFAFSLQSLLFSLRPKDPAGIENRYFDYTLFPLLLCSASTFLSALRPFAPTPRIARAVGLALLGTWFLQMGFSFFTGFIASGCQLHRRSWADYTIKCKTHEDYHRGRAIATLQFNCHLALVVVAGVVVYAVAVARGAGIHGYSDLGKEMEEVRDSRSFVLVSDDEDDEIEVGDAVKGGEH